MHVESSRLQGGITNGELVEAQHVHYTHLCNAACKEVWALQLHTSYRHMSRHMAWRAFARLGLHVSARQCTRPEYQS